MKAARRGQLLVYVVLLAGVLAMMAGLRRCGLRGTDQEGPMSAGSGGDTIDVGIEYGPLWLYRYGDTLGGEGYDLLRRLEAGGGFHFKYHPVVSVEEALEGLDGGRLDVVVGGIPQSSAITESYCVTGAVTVDRQLLVQRRDSSGGVAVRSQLDLGGKTVWVQKGSPVVERIGALSSEIGDTIYVMEEGEYGNEQLVIMVATGEIDFAVVNERTAQELGARYSDLDLGTAVSFNQFQRWILRKDDVELAARLDSALRRLKGD